MEPDKPNIELDNDFWEEIQDRAKSDKSSGLGRLSVLKRSSIFRKINNKVI